VRKAGKLELVLFDELHLKSYSWNAIAAVQ
jgi:hypothetical protein